MLLTPINGERLSLHTPEQKEFIADNEKRDFTDGSLSFQWDNLVRAGHDRSVPEPVVFSWETETDMVFLFVSRSSDMQNAHCFPVNTGKRQFEIYNLNIGTDYWWRVESAEEASPVYSFSIPYETPRGIYIDGITNVRDIGGYKTISGKRICQNMAYRGSELDIHMNISDKGKKTFCEELKIKTDLDMRGEASGVITEGSLASEGIAWKLIPLCPYDDIFISENKKQYGLFFREFLYPERYPIYFHCWGGADRAGTFAFLLGALLGMGSDDLINEYEWTSLSIWGIRTRNYDKFRNFLNKLNDYGDENDSLQQKTENFVFSAGLTKGEIQKIREILME